MLEQWLSVIALVSTGYRAANLLKQHINSQVEWKALFRVGNGWGLRVVWDVLLSGKVF